MPASAYHVIRNTALTTPASIEEAPKYPAKLICVSWDQADLSQAPAKIGAGQIRKRLEPSRLSSSASRGPAIAKYRYLSQSLLYLLARTTYAQTIGCRPNTSRVRTTSTAAAVLAVRVLWSSPQKERKLLLNRFPKPGFQISKRPDSESPQVTC